jgi:hypothetical protein
MSKVIPVSRSDTAQSLARTCQLGERPNSGRRTGGPQFTHRGVYRAPPTASGSVAAPRQRQGTLGRPHPDPSDGGA